MKHIKNFLFVLNMVIASWCSYQNKWEMASTFASWAILTQLFIMQEKLKR